MNYLLLPTFMASPLSWLISNAGWRKALLIQGGVSMLVLCISYAVCPKGWSSVKRQVGSVATDEHPAARRTELIISKSPTKFNRTDFLLFYMVTCLCAIVYFFAEAQPQSIFEAELPKTSIGILIGTTLNLVANTVARLGWGMVASRCHAGLVLACGMVLAGSSLVAWAIYPKSTVVSLSASAGVTVGSASMWTLIPVIAEQTFGADQASSVYAWSLTAQIVAAFLGAPVLSQIADLSGWPTAMHVLACVSVVSAALLLALRCRGRQREVALPRERQVSITLSDAVVKSDIDIPHDPELLAGEYVGA